MVSLRPTLLTVLTAAAAALTVPSTEAQNVGAVISITNSTVTGDLTSGGLNRSIVTGSALGNNNLANSYGGYSSITATLAPEITPFATFGAAIVSGSTLNVSNVNVLSVTNSVIDVTAAGYNSVAKNVGQVTQVSATLGASPTVDTGLISLSNTQLPKGDETATSFNNSLVADTAAGNGALANNYGGYTSATVSITQPASSSTPTRTGSIYLNGSTVGSGNLTATDVEGGVSSQNVIGYGSKNTGVGSVVKITFNLN